ncbi:MAG: endonuclease MutS2 [Candidatus Obscuribacterales bacterium]|nr:endonuclease MutS2 [Candidatus Obscuribacterales bacterium]
MSQISLEQRTLKSLEWERLRQYLAAESSCAWSRELCRALEPSTERLVIEELLNETTEALELFRAGFDLAQENLPDLRDVLPRLLTGSTLAAAELLDLRKMLKLARRTKTFLHAAMQAEEGRTGDENSYPCMRRIDSQLYSLEELVTDIEQVIDEYGSIRDDASPQLRGLRKEVHRLTNEVREELQRLINSSTVSKCLQEPIYTQRGGRYVLPVNASMRRSVEGIVHDSSASGLTVFVEPVAVVELTNRIRIKESEIEREIERLLSALCSKARVKHEQLQSSFVGSVELDFIVARARLAHKYEGVRPLLEQEPVMRLERARHPLLVLQSAGKGGVVPNDIELGVGELRTLVITGPNTGGKTVFLKTAGLHCLMVRAGLLLPAREGSSIGIFDQVFADIGDEQSLEQNLSTFSSHMGTIIEITRRSSGGTLVLLDEIGAGTDPREGVVLARVILSQLKRSGALTLCSTHYGELKTLAHSQTGFSNASMEFDDSSLRPTYRLQPGVPGNSHALEIAKRLGLPDELADEAASILISERPAYAIAIEELERRTRALAALENALTEKQEALDQQSQLMLKRQQELEKQIVAARDRAATSFDDDYRTAKKLISELTASLQKEPSLNRAQKAREQLEQVRNELGWNKPAKEAEKPGFSEGQNVRIRSLNQRGVIESLQDGHVEVRVGGMRVKVLLSDIESSSAPPRRETSRRERVQMAVAGRTISPGAAPSFIRSDRNTIDLRGKRVDEAMPLAERFLDTCYLEHISPVMIIHGHGTGAIKGAVRDFLRDCSYKLTHRSGDPHEGGDGVTVISF